MSGDFPAVVGAGSLRAADASAVHFPHRWTEDGVSVESDFTGAHLLHLAVAGCVLNDLYREAATLGVLLDGARVRATGGFDASWQSTEVAYTVEVRSQARAEDIEHLLHIVDEVAEIPRSIRAGASVRRAP